MNILENCFYANKSEWEMISKKAKKWIRQQNVDIGMLNKFEGKVNELVKFSDEDELDELDELAMMMAI